MVDLNEVQCQSVNITNASEQKSLDVVGSTCGMFETGGGSTYALKGQYGSLLWKMKGVGNEAKRG